MPFNIGIVGCGAIAQIIVKNLEKMKIKDIRIEIIFDRHNNRIELLSNQIPYDVMGTSDITNVYQSNLDLVIECASQDAVRDYAKDIINSNKDLMIMSVGALLDSELYDTLIDIAKKNSRKIYIPSGAISGIDALKAAKLDGIESVTLVTSKNPKSIEQTPYLNEKNIILDNVVDRTLIFSGSAKEAVIRFPNNINVAAILSLSGLGMKHTTVKLYADPQLDKNVHEIKIKGKFGKITSKIENVPSPQNPKTSYLAALSAIKTLIEICEPISIGT